MNNIKSNHKSNKLKDVNNNRRKENNNSKND